MLKRNKVKFAVTLPNVASLGDLGGVAETKFEFGSRFCGVDWHDIAGKRLFDVFKVELFCYNFQKQLQRIR